MFDRKRWVKDNPEKIKKIKKRYREKNSERIKEYQKRWRADHPLYKKKDKKEYDKIYRKNNHEKIKTINKEYYEKNKEIMLKQCKQYRKKNKEHISKRDKEYRKNNGDSIYITAKKYWRNNKEKIKKHRRKYLETEKGKACLQRQNVKRRVIERDVINTLTAQEWLDILEKYNYRCVYCDVEFEVENMPHKDHVIPISKGGDNTKENVVPACQSCNSKKGNKIVEPLINRNCLAEKARRKRQEQLGLFGVVG